MIVYVLRADGEIAAFHMDAFGDALAYPFDAGIVPPDAARWQDVTRNGVREWLLVHEGIECIITELPLIGERNAA